MGWGVHWVINDAQAAQLTGALQDALATLPKGNREVIDNLLGKYAPWAALAGCTYTLVAPRVMETRYLYEQAQAAARAAGASGDYGYANNGNGANATQGFPAQGDSGDGGGGSSGASRVADIGEFFNRPH